MERPTPLTNFVLLVQALGLALVVDVVTEFWSAHHVHTVWRGLVVYLVGRDPARPRGPDDWQEWYNS